VEGQGKKGANPESRSVEMGKEDNEDGRGASGSVARRMPIRASGRTREMDAHQEQLRESES